MYCIGFQQEEGKIIMKMKTIKRGADNNKEDDGEDDDKEKNNSREDDDEEEQQEVWEQKEQMQE
jgi:hypothetical protein